MGIEKFFSNSVRAFVLASALALGAGAQDYSGPRGDIIKNYLKLAKEKASGEYVWPGKETSYLHIIQNEPETGNAPAMGRLVIGVNGVKTFADIYGKDYLVIYPTGRLLKVSPEDLFDEKIFKRVSDVYDDGGRVQMLGFPSNHRIPKKNAIVLHPGTTPRQSVLEERLGKLDPDLNSKLDGYGGRVASRLYSPKPNAMVPGKELGYIVDVWAPPEYKIKGEDQSPRLKKFIATSTKDSKDPDIPEFILTLGGSVSLEQYKPYIFSDIKDPDNHNVHYLFPVPKVFSPASLDKFMYKTACVVDGQLEPKKQGVFDRFDDAIVIDGLNN